MDNGDSGSTKVNTSTYLQCRACHSDSSQKLDDGA